ncbi:MAG: DUF3078 domain-containing protein [Candidatus Kapabacteria bacterium]|nr:DUF3078 domain-containing protein [Candidatus Kapabacteria bacterium]
MQADSDGKGRGLGTRHTAVVMWKPGTIPSSLPATKLGLRTHTAYFCRDLITSLNLHMPRTLTLALVVSLLFSSTLFAQVDAKVTIDSLSRIPVNKAASGPWSWYTKFGVGFTTVQLTNWTGGGQDAISVALNCLASYDYADSVFYLDNEMQLGYGLVRQGKQAIQKSDDRIILSSRASHNTSHWYRFTGFVDLRSQFVDGFNYGALDSLGNPTLISSFFAPAFLTAALGAELRPVPQVKILAAPLSSRSTFVSDDRIIAAGVASGSGAFGLAPGERSKTSLGAVVNASIDWEMFTNVTLRTRFNGFMPYETPDLWVVTLENAVNMKVNSWLNISWLSDVFYDHRIPVLRTDGTTGPATQLRNQLIVNINWNLGS